jgi:DNA polymerase-3 subunit beta
VAADRGDTLPILTGVRVAGRGRHQVTLLATDRYRLAMRELHLEPARRPTRAYTSCSSQRARLVRHLAQGRWAPAVRSTSPLAAAAGGDGLVGFEAGQRHTTTRLLDGEYPKVASIFPSSSETESVRAHQ